jgi:GINS complex subunit 4
MVDTLRSDPHTSEEEHFKLVLVQTEMERVKFVIRSYVRTRLHKVSESIIVEDRQPLMVD